jgi:hypothetical protein
VDGGAITVQEYKVTVAGSQPEDASTLRRGASPRLLTTYSRYYHRSRTPLGLEKDTPDHRPVSGTSIGPTVAISEVDSLDHRYERRAP